MSNLSIMFSSQTDEWATPQEFFDKLNKEFHFTLDPCALPSNAKCKRYFTPADNGLLQNWGGQIVFCNPPYGRAIYDWVRKCSEEAQTKHYGCRSHTSANRYKILSRVYLS